MKRKKKKASLMPVAFPLVAVAGTVIASTGAVVESGPMVGAGLIILIAGFFLFAGYRIVCS